MYFEKGEIYHIYNRGNNRDKVFYSRDNYLFFLEKVRLYVSPFSDILAWCLMPNHFHLMVYVNEIELTLIEQTDKYGKIITGVTTVSDNSSRKIRTLNNSVGILLRSYTNAIQKQEGRTGSLFQDNTKAVSLTATSDLTPSYFNTAFGTQMNVSVEAQYYPQVCFNYIHQNPVAANLVNMAEEWEFSSYRDYAGFRNGRLINRSKTKELGLSI